MYAKILPTQSILDITPVSEGEQPEHVVLGQVVTNYPDTGGGWIPTYSTDEYITLAKPLTIPPENEVGLTESQYMYDFVNHYWGTDRPI